MEDSNSGPGTIPQEGNRLYISNIVQYSPVLYGGYIIDGV